MMAIARAALLGALVASATALHLTNKDDTDTACKCRTWHEAFSTHFHDCRPLMSNFLCDDMFLKMKNTSSCVSDWDFESIPPKSIDEAASVYFGFRNRTEQYCIVDATCSEGDEAAVDHWGTMPKLWKRKRCGAGDDHLSQKTFNELVDIAIMEGVDLGMLAKLAYPVVHLPALTGTLREELEKAGTYGIVVHDGSFNGSFAPVLPFDVVTPCGTMTITGEYLTCTFEEKEVLSNSAKCKQYDEKDRPVKEARLERERLARERALEKERRRLEREKLEREALLEKQRREKLERLPASLIGEDFEWEEGRQLNCDQQKMITPKTRYTPKTKPLKAGTAAECKTKCAIETRCHGATFITLTQQCLFLQNVDLSKCIKSEASMSYKKLGAKDPDVADILSKLPSPGARR